MLFFLIFHHEKEQKAAFSESHPKVVTSYLSPIIAKKARSFGIFRDCMLFYEIRKSAFLALFWH